MSAHLHSRKMASPAKAFIGPIRAWPSRTRTQVSFSASSSQFDLGGKFNPFKDEMRVAASRVLAVGEALGARLAFGRPRFGGRHSLVDVNLPFPAVVEQTKRRIASLLDFGNRQARADGVNRAGGDVNDIVLHNTRAREPDPRSNRPRSRSAIAEQ